MKRNIFLLLLVSLLGVSGVSAQTGNAETIRAQIADYLKSKGISTELNGNALSFEKDSCGYLMIFDGAEPTYVELRLYDVDVSECHVPSIQKATNYVNVNFGALKAVLSTDNRMLELGVEMYVRKAESVMENLDFYTERLVKSLKVIDAKYHEFADNRDIMTRDIPFEVYSADVANVDKGDNIITPLDKDIPSSETQYINTMLTMNVYSEGEYQVDVKFITPTGCSRVDENSEFSFSVPLNMTKSNKTYLAGGWGSPNPGTWPAGDYQVELYYKGRLFYIKKFSIH